MKMQPKGNTPPITIPKRKKSEKNQLFYDNLKAKGEH